jgi:membrane associated rhomboid family serine protease
MPRINLTPVVLNLMIINGLVFVASLIYPDFMRQYIMLVKLNFFGLHEQVQASNGIGYVVNIDGMQELVPGSSFFKPIQIIASFFAHGGFMHIAFNMFGLAMLGPALEHAMGVKRFLFSYLLIGIGASLIITLFDPSPIPVLGASSVTSGLTVLFAYYYPQARMGLMFIPGTFQIGKFVIGFAVISTLLIIIGQLTGQSMGGISHFGHLSGMAVAFLYLKSGDLRKLVQGKR